MQVVDEEGAPALGLGQYPTETAEDGTERPVEIKLIGEGDPQVNAVHMEKVKARFAEFQTPAYQEVIKQRAEAIEQLAPRDHRARLMQAAAQAPSTTKKIAWLRREADLTVRASAGNSACGAGCNWCCRMGVAVTEHEVRVIAKETGRSLSEPGAGRVYEFDLSNLEGAEAMMRSAAELENTQGARWTGVKCPFLSDEPGAGCSIYRSRPLACRNLINLDTDELLCKLVEGGRITVPYLGRVESQLAGMLALGPKLRIADLRDWFEDEKSD